jgi:hypothetical protein
MALHVKCPLGSPGVRKKKCKRNVQWLARIFQQYGFYMVHLPSLTKICHCKKTRILNERKYEPDKNI